MGKSTFYKSYVLYVAVHVVKIILRVIAIYNVWQI